MLNKLRLSLFPTGGLKSILTLITGAGLAQAIPFIASFWLARLYPVSAFSLYTLFTAISSILAVISTGRFELAVPLPESKEHSWHIIQLSLTIAFFLSVIALIAVLFFKHQLAVLSGNPLLEPYLILAPVFIFFYGAFQTGFYYLLRENRFRMISLVRILQSVIVAATGILAGIYVLPFNGLITGLVAGCVVSSITAWLIIFKKENFTSSLTVIDRKILRYNAIKHRDLPIVNSSQAFADTFQSSAVVFIISSCFGQIINGLYGFTVRILQAPLMIIGNAVGLVFYKKALTENNSGKKLYPLVKRTIFSLAILAFPFFLVLFVWGEDIFSIFFGVKWQKAGYFAGLMSPWLYMNFIVSPLSHLPIVLKKQRQVFLFSLAGNALILISILCGAYLFSNFYSGLIMLSITQVIYYSCIIGYFLTISG